MTHANEEPSEPVFGDNPPQARTLLGNKRYDQLKFVAQVLLPALATFYASFGALWEFPKTQEVVGSLIALDLFLGILLGLATRQYETSGAKYSGAAFVKTSLADDGETPLTQVAVAFKPEVDGQQVEQQKEITLKVINE